MATPQDIKTEQTLRIDGTKDPLNLAGLRAPDTVADITAHRVLTPKAVFQLRDMTQQFYAELELFIDTYSRGMAEFGLRARPVPPASVSHLDQRCTRIIETTYPLVLALAFSQGEAVLKSVAAEMKAMSQDFRLFLRQFCRDGTVGEDMLPNVVSRCIDLQRGMAQPIDQLGALAFQMLVAPEKTPRGRKQREAA